MNSSSANNFLLKSVQPSAAPAAVSRPNYQDDQPSSFAENFKEVQVNTRMQQEQSAKQDQITKQEKSAKSAAKKAMDKPVHEPEPKPTALAKAPKEIHSTDVREANEKPEAIEEPNGDQVIAEGNQAAQTQPSETFSLPPVGVDVDVQVGGETRQNAGIVPATATSDEQLNTTSELLKNSGLQTASAGRPLVPAASTNIDAAQGPLMPSMANQQGIAAKSAPVATPLSTAAVTDELGDSESVGVLAGLLSAEDSTTKALPSKAAESETDPKAEPSKVSLLDVKTSFEKTLQSLARGESGGSDEGRSQAAPPLTNSTSPSGLDSLMRAGESSTPAARSFVVQTAVPMPLGQPQWSQAVGDKVLWLAAQNISSAEIILNPEHLGPMQVKVSVHQDQTTVSFTSHHAVVREVLDQNLGRLRDMFSEQGLNLVNVDVSDKSFSRQQGEAQDQKGQSRNTENAEEETPASVSMITQQRLVDHYA